MQEAASTLSRPDAEYQCRTYRWPRKELGHQPEWRTASDGLFLSRDMPERMESLADDSAWPAFFPSPICFVTAADESGAVLEKVVGPSIVNRFPYVVALSFCRQRLSERHHVRRQFTGVLERGGKVAIQFLPPGQMTDQTLHAITATPENRSRDRIAHSGLSTRTAATSQVPVFNDAYMVYEASLVKPGHDFDGRPIYQRPWLDVGSHRVYFFEINAVQLRDDIADGRRRIHWRGLPRWKPSRELQPPLPNAEHADVAGRYEKGYTPDYSFPSAGTVAFEADEFADGMAIRYLPPLPADQVEIDNDRARWPCFFPSSVGMITTWTREGLPDVMPCGSTTILSRHPLVVAPCVSYASINERYAPRASLETIRATRRFGCGVPFIHDAVVRAIRYAGNYSITHDSNKLTSAGLAFKRAEWAPLLPALPVHFDCEVVGEVRLGTHVMFLGEVRRIHVRTDVTPDNALEWSPWAEITNGQATETSCSGAASVG